MEDKLEILSVKNIKKEIYFLLVNDIIIASLCILNGKSYKYISILDSNGLCRGYTTDFVLTVLKEISGLIICFSHPKTSLIFRENKNKNILLPRNLFDFWKNIFLLRCK